MGSIIIINNSSSTCHVFVSKYTQSDGSDDWYTVGPGQRDSWTRNAGWELVAFRSEDNSDRSGVYVRVNSTVQFNGLHNLVVV